MTPAFSRYARKAARFTLRQIPIRAYHRMIRRDVIGFFYHTITDEPLPYVRHLYTHKTPAAFENDVAFLERRYRLVSLPEILQPPVSNGRPAAFISFDDGMTECFRTVRPILLRHKAPCLFFITTAFLDNKEMFYRHKVSLCIEHLKNAAEEERDEILRRCGMRGAREFTTWLKGMTFADQDRIDSVCETCGIDVAAYLSTHRPYMTTDEIKQLAAEGFIIGAHSRRHPVLPQLPSPAAIEAEIVESCQTLRALTGADRIPFAFPYSGDNLDRSFLQGLLARHSFIGPLFDAHGIGLDEPFIRHRIWGDVPRSAGVLIHQAYVEELQKHLRIAND